MEFLQLKYFCSAAETENFSQTAKQYFVPVSNISQSIKRLERELGCELFDHLGNKVVLNSEGKKFYESASKALSLLEREKTNLLERKKDLCGDIRLVCLTNRRIVTKAIEAFTQRYPNVNFIIHHTQEPAMDYDILISDSCAWEHSKRILLFDEEILLAMRKDHAMASTPSLSVADLEKERFITMTAGNSIHRITVDTCMLAGFSPNIILQTDDPFYVRKYVEMGLGIAFIPSISWNDLFSDNVVLKKMDGMRRKTYAYLPKRKFCKRSVETFLEILQGLSSHGA